MSNKTPLVSVICSCYNHSNYVEKTLDSVINQSYNNIQLIIIDDFSTDNSVFIIENWIKKRKQGILIKNEKNLGLTTSFNQAFSIVKGKYFIDLAADDLLLEHCIETQVNTFENIDNTNVGIVYGNATIYNENDTLGYNYYDQWPQKKITTTPKDGFIYKEILSHSNTICSISALIKTAVFKNLGGYDSNLIYEDYDFWLRVSRTYFIIYIDNILVKKLELTNSLGSIANKKRSKRALLYYNSTHLIVKKTYIMNRDKIEDLASIKKIKIEIAKNIRVPNLILILKYYYLLLKFWFRTSPTL